MGAGRESCPHSLDAPRGIRRSALEWHGCRDLRHTAARWRDRAIGRGGETLDTATIIESESRELIRRRGLDVHADQLEPLIREVLADYDRRSSSGEVPVLHDDDTMVAQVAARICGFGPLQERLDDPGVEEIWLNSPSRMG